MRQRLSNICPHCKYLADSASEAKPGAKIGRFVPKSGDLALCIRCGEWAIYTGDGLRMPTDDEFFHIGMSDDCKHARLAWTRMKAEAEG